MKSISEIRKALKLREEEIKRLREERDYFKAMFKQAKDYRDLKTGDEDAHVWVWQGDGEDYPRSLANDISVVIRGDELREEIKRSACDAVESVADRLVAAEKNPNETNFMWDASDCREWLKEEAARMRVTFWRSENQRIN